MRRPRARLHLSNAVTLYALVQKEGMGNTRIVITGSNPPQSHYAHAQPRPQLSDGPGYQRYRGRRRRWWSRR